MTERHLDPQYLKETAQIIKELGNGNGRTRRDLWHWWLEQKVEFMNLPLEERRRRLVLRVNLDELK